MTADDTTMSQRLAEISHAVRRIARALESDHEIG